MPVSLLYESTRQEIHKQHHNDSCRGQGILGRPPSAMSSSRRPLLQAWLEHVIEGRKKTDTKVVAIELKGTFGGERLIRQLHAEFPRRNFLTGPHTGGKKCGCICTRVRSFDEPLWSRLRHKNEDAWPPTTGKRLFHAYTGPQRASPLTMSPNTSSTETSHSLRIGVEHATHLLDSCVAEMPAAGLC